MALASASTESGASRRPRSGSISSSSIRRGPSARRHDVDAGIGDRAGHSLQRVLGKEPLRGARFMRLLAHAIADAAQERRLGERVRERTADVDERSFARVVHGVLERLDEGVAVDQQRVEVGLRRSAAGRDRRHQ